jgi:hypothetical protein
MDSCLASPTTLLFATPPLGLFKLTLPLGVLLPAALLFALLEDLLGLFLVRSVRHDGTEDSSPRLMLPCRSAHA